jgi:hypothetical protein
MNDTTTQGEKSMTSPHEHPHYIVCNPGGQEVPTKGAVMNARPRLLKIDGRLVIPVFCTGDGVDAFRREVGGSTGVLPTTAELLQLLRRLWAECNVRGIVFDPRPDDALEVADLEVFLADMTDQMESN